MNKIPYKINLDVTKAETQKCLTGFCVGETESRQIVIALQNGRNTVELDGSEVISMYVRRPSDVTPSIGLCTIDGNNVVYDVLQDDVAEEGITEFTIKVQQSIEGVPSITYAAQFCIQVIDTKSDDSHVPEDPSYSILESLINEVAEYQSDSEAFAAGTRGGEPVEEGDPAYHNNAKYYSENVEILVEEQVQRAEAWATGTRDGEPVGEDDPAFMNNSKFFEEQAYLHAYVANNAKNSAYASEQAALASRGGAKTSELIAEGYSVGKQNGTDVTSDSPYYHNNAKYYSDKASNDAETASLASATSVTNGLKAEGYAVGKQNGTDVSSDSPYYHNNAKYFSEKASNDAGVASGASTTATESKDIAVAKSLEAEGYAYGTQNGVPVGPESLYYHNNCKWYKEQAGSIVGDKVDSFNGRTGIVVPENGDYMSIENAIAVNMIPQKPNKIESGITYTVNSDGSITVNGTATSGTSFYFAQASAGQMGYVQDLEDGTYTLHGVPNDLPDGCKLEVMWADSNGVMKNAETSNTTPIKTFSFTGHGNTGSGGTYIRFRVENGSVFDNVTIYPMLEKGSIAHEYVGYVGSNDKINEVVRGKANASHEHSASDITGGTFGGDVSAPATAQYTDATISNIVATDTAPTEGAMSTYPNKTLVVVYS